MGVHQGKLAQLGPALVVLMVCKPYLIVENYDGCVYVTRNWLSAHLSSNSPPTYSTCIACHTHSYTPGEHTMKTCHLCRFMILPFTLWGMERTVNSLSLSGGSCGKTDWPWSSLHSASQTVVPWRTHTGRWGLAPGFFCNIPIFSVC